MGKRTDGSLFPVAFSANTVTDKKGGPLCLFGSFIDISEQKKDRHLSEHIIDNLPGIFFMFDLAEDKITRWNKRVEVTTGYSSRELYDIPFIELVYEADRQKADQKIRDGIKNGKDEAEIRIITKDGRIIPFYFTGFLVSIDQKTFLIVNGIDISARKDAEEKLRKKYEQVQLLANLSDAVSKSSRLEDIYRLALHGLLTTLDVDRASVLLFDETGVMQFKDSHGLSAAYIAAATGHSPWKVNDTDTGPIYMPDAEKEESLKELLPVIRNEGIRALGFIPLVYMNRLLGKFMIYYNEVHEFTEEESQLAQTIAREVAFAIGEKESEMALRKSEQQYRDVVNNVKEIIFQINSAGYWTFLNPAWTAFLGYSAEESIGKKYMDFVYPEDLTASRERFEKLCSGEAEFCQQEMRFVTKMHTIRWMEVIARRVADNNQNIVGIAGTLNDITERKKAREQILKEKELSDSIINTLPGIFYIYDDQGKFYRWNKNLELITGYSSGEIIRMNPLQFFDDDEKGYMAERNKATFINGKADAEANLYTKNKSKLQYYFNCIAITYEGKLCSMGMGIDITERKKAEAAIKKTTMQLRELSAHLQDIREEERTEIAREIHDELGQQLTVLKFDLSWMEGKLKTDDTLYSKKFTEIKGLLDHTIETVRRLASQLRPSLLDDLGLIATIEWYLEDFGKRFNIKTKFRYSSETLELPDKIRTALFRIFQESITNVLRHAQASGITVTLNQEDDNIRLQIMDDGKGFDMTGISGRKTLGLLGMKERTLLMGGDYRIDSFPGKGTTVTVSVSLSSLAVTV
jgi:PAS domain S-box-containing protein